MSVMIQIRNVPDDLHRTMKARAAKDGLSLSDYLLNSIRREAERPTLEDLYARLLTREPVRLDVDMAELIREDRDSR